MFKTSELDEPVLEDSYPVHAFYWYVADGKPIRSDISSDVRALKILTGSKEIRRCDAVKRKLPLW